MRISVIGLGKLGLPMAALFASKGHKVIGIDYNEKLVKAITNGDCPVYETGLEELLTKSNSNLQVTTDMKQVKDSDICFILVPTPSDKNGAFSNEYIMSVIQSILPTIKQLDYPPLLVITSTVMPGTCDQITKEIKLPICYNPEFIALGSVIRDMEKPDAILIGESSKEAGDLLETFHKQLHGRRKIPISRMNLINAEIAKISLNVTITTKISIANTITEICDEVPGGDVDAITNFLGLDSRIGVKYLKGGLGFGGTCFPRDNRAFISFAKELGTNHDLQVATDRFNSKHNVSIIPIITRLLGISDSKAATIGLSGKTVSVLGLTYKPETNVVEESQILPAIRILLNLRARVKVYDPAGMNNAKRQLGEYVEYAEDVPHCLKDSDLCVIATPWKEFETLSYDVFIDFMKQPIVLDCWRLLDRKELKQARIKYHALGVNS